MFCTNCGEKLEDKALFCTSCGQKTENAAAAPPPVAPAPPAVAPTPPPVVAVAPKMAAVPPARPPAKSGNSKLFVWMGALVVLIAVTAGLAYVAFQKFLHTGDGAPPETQQAQIEPEVSAPMAEVVAGEPVAEDEVEPPAEEPPPVAAPAPVEAPTPAPAPAPTRAAAPKPAPKPSPSRTPAPSAPVVAPKPVETPKPVEPAVTATPPAPPPAAPTPVPVVKSEPPPPPPSPKGSKVMLSGTDAYSPPPAPKPASPTAPAAPPVRAAATSGDIFWSGTLDKNQVVTVDFASGPAGIGGQPLPGKPVKLEVFSPVVEITELPGPGNGWKRFSFKATRNAKKSVTINFRWALTQ